MKKQRWGATQSKILSEYIHTLKSNRIRYFIIGTYEGLPELNCSKDVDIVVDPTCLDRSKYLLKEVYKQNGLSYMYHVKHSKLNCCHGISRNGEISIHIDLIANYSSKGYEIFGFDELYENVVEYKGISVLNEIYSGLMLLIYKQFNQTKPKLKLAYQKEIYDCARNYPEFKVIVDKLVGRSLAVKILKLISENDFESLISINKPFTKALRLYCYKKQPRKTIFSNLEFIAERTKKLIFSYSNHSKTIAIMAPDGAGKTTFLDALLKRMTIAFVNEYPEDRCSVNHFRPNLIPNLGVIGEKAKIAKQDTDFTNPHRAKPAGQLSSLVRLSYYWLDYVLGFAVKVRKDVHFDKFSIFDRYCFDLLVDPKRSKIGSPFWLRKLFITFMQKPKVYFRLHAPAELIYERKQELTLEEIRRQNKLFNDVANSYPKLVTSIDSSQPVEAMVDEAMVVILEQYAEKL